MLYLLFLILNVFCIDLSLGQIGDSCTTNTNSSGICQKLIDCPVALQQVREGKQPKICDFQGLEPIICCDSRSKLEIGVTSKAKCKEYEISNEVRRKAKNIVGGTKSRVNEFPHMVALGYGDAKNIAWECGGTLISEQFVLTAAHCTHSRLQGPVKFARIGTINVKNPSVRDAHQDFNITQTIPHPEYAEPSKYNDIALLKLNIRAFFDNNVKPACLDVNLNMDGVGLIATGWGLLESGGDASANLMKVELVKYSYENCNRTYFDGKGNSLSNGIAESSQICAGGKPNEEKDTCHGDSGGPLQIKTGVQYTVVGVTSFGKDCGFRNIPGVYTKVSHYITWIENIVWPVVIAAS